MADSDKTVSYGVTADPSPFEAGLQRASDSGRNFASNIDSSFRKVGDAFGAVQKQLLVLAGIVAGGAFFKDAIAESNKLTGETMKLSRALGLTGEQASTLHTALGDIGSSGDDYIAVFTKFARQLKNNEDGLRAQGLATRDANGNLRDSDTLFREALASVGSYKAGLDQNTYAQSLFGKSLDEVMKLQKLNIGVLEEAKRKNQELGLVVSKENVEASKAYKLAMNDVSDVLLAVKKTIGDAVMPVFTELAEYFASTGPYVVEIFKGAMLGLLTVFEVIKGAVRILAGVLFEAINQIADVGGLLGELFVNIVKADYSQAVETGRKIGQRLKDGVRNVVTNMSDVAAETGSAIARDFARVYGPKTAIDAPTGGTKRQGEFKDPKDTSRVSGWDAELAERKLAFQEAQNLAGTFYQLSKADELAYWKDKLAVTVTGSAENVAVRRKAAELQLAIGVDAYNHELASLATREAAFKTNMDARLALLAQEASLVRQRFGEESKEYEDVQKKITEAKRQAVEQQKQIDLMRADSTRAAALSELQLLEQQAVLERDLHLATVAEQIAGQQQFEDRRFQIAMEGLRQRIGIASADPDRNPVEMERMHSEVEALERSHQLRLGEIKSQAAREQARYTMSIYDSMNSGFASVLQKTLQGSATITQTVRGLMQAVGTAVSQALAKMAADWLMVQIRNLVMGKAMALSSVSEKAAEAGAAGTASMAGAPFPINLGAPAFGAAMSAMALSFAPLASASGGYDIPSNVNPLVQAHASEMVLPAKQADVIRQMADNGQQPGGAGAGGQPAVELRVGKMPGDFFGLHRDELVKLLRVAQRDFSWKPGK